MELKLIYLFRAQDEGMDTALLTQEIENVFFGLQ